MDPMTNAPPYNNLDLRLALAYAADREAILKTIFRGYGKLGNDQPVPHYMPEYAADIPQRTYDPDKAKFHLKKSGYTGPITFTVSDAASFGAVESAQVFQAGAAKAGVNFQIDRVPNDGYYAKYWKKVPFSACTWGGRSTANIVLNVEFASNSAMNGSFWKNEKFDQLLISSRAETNAQRRMQMYHDMQQLVHDDVGALVLVFNSNIDAGSKKVHGFVPSPVQQLSNYRAAEQIWLSDT
jgi:peptide/nickel transport system substrate-binding protein